MSLSKKNMGELREWAASRCDRSAEVRAVFDFAVANLDQFNWMFGCGPREPNQCVRTVKDQVKFQMSANAEMLRKHENQIAWLIDELRVLREKLDQHEHPTQDSH